MSPELTQEELDAIAQKEADELLANHLAAVTLTPEEIARLEREKQELVGRIALDRDSGGGPVARRLGTNRHPRELPDYEPPAAQKIPQATIEAVHVEARAIDTIPAATGLVDLEKVDPIQLAELAEDAKAKRKRYLALQTETDTARTEYEQSNARFMAYLQQ